MGNVKLRFWTSHKVLKARNNFLRFTAFALCTIEHPPHLLEHVLCQLGNQIFCIRSKISHLRPHRQVYQCTDSGKRAFVQYVVHRVRGGRSLRAKTGGKSYTCRKYWNYLKTYFFQFKNKKIHSFLKLRVSGGAFSSSRIRSLEGIRREVRVSGVNCGYPATNWGYPAVFTWPNTLRSFFLSWPNTLEGIRQLRVSGRKVRVSG